MEHGDKKLQKYGKRAFIMNLFKFILLFAEIKFFAYRHSIEIITDQPTRDKNRKKNCKANKPNQIQRVSG